MKLSPFEQVRQLEFDLPARQLTVYHSGSVDPLNTAITELNLNSTLLNTVENQHWEQKVEYDEKKLLWTVLLINFFLFIVEIIAGFVANSMGLVADSLDMLADALVYGMSLYAVGKLSRVKKNVARTSGYFQVMLAVLGFIEVIRRFAGYEAVPDFQTMIAISVLALAGNAVSLYLLQKSRSTDAHIKASLIFTNNDVIINIGVIVAGVAVFLTNSKYPDLVIGSVVFFLVARGAFRILNLAK